ncbi:ribonuclease Z [Terribacillus saccharophilus]|uniref:Ribonuclease Z n=1 Tax=Terribacillus saccharophilus TaxID=361277 RepID=A0A268ADE3_9BACI|nr:ribonuclease Z [Terribacillus saccharophilus]PAD22132.1 ribonuclease Z [Terribacillus saccharophilus]
MELHFLGTGAGLPSKDRNVTSICLSMPQERQAVWMFDCGEATQHQLLYSPLKPGKIEKIFITHLHGDHIYGLPGLLSTRSFQQSDLQLEIYGPLGIKEFIEVSLRVSGSNVASSLIIHEIEPGRIFEDEGWTVDAVQLSHGITCLGYIVEEKAVQGELKVEKLRHLGISPGPIYRQIKNQEITELPDGQQIKRSDVVGPDKPGRKIAILGDTTYLPELKDNVEGADILVHESTFSADEPEMAKAYGHSTALQAASLASKANVKKLILTHISARYHQDDAQILAEQAQTVFLETELAEDMRVFDIPKNSSDS